MSRKANTSSVWVWTPFGKSLRCSAAPPTQIGPTRRGTSRGYVTRRGSQICVRGPERIADGSITVLQYSAEDLLRKTDRMHGLPPHRALHRCI
eukprot:scaffold2671_cov252-Pinguiococcus_pyrenoidosus.AAC.24